MPAGVRLASGASEPDAGRGGEVLVTPPKRFTGEIGQVDTALFVDWLSLSQEHPIRVPRRDAGCVMGIDADGQIRWKTERSKRIEGSFESSVNVRSDGHRVTFDGNVSRFGRPSNLFGFDLAECMRRVNELLAELDLPPFTMGCKGYRPDRQGNVQAFWTGCRVRRIDLTANYATGGEADAAAYMAWLATQQHSARIKVGTHAEGETVDWGRGSRRLYAKAYVKHAEMAKHGAPAELIDFAREKGVVRFELTVKANQLQTMGCQYLGSIDMGQLEELFAERRSVMVRAQHEHDGLESLPNHVRRTARDYLAGDDLSARLSKVTFWRHRKALLPFAIDIAVRRNVFAFQPRVRVIELRECTPVDLARFIESRKAA